MAEHVRSYYDSELYSTYVFIGFGVVTSVAGGVVLTQDGDFARGLGWSSLVGGGLVALGGAGYGVTVIPRRERFVSLFEKDRAKFKREETEHIAGTNSRFPLYLGLELATAVGGGAAIAYGFFEDDDVIKGLGVGGVVQGLGLFALELPGALRASRYADQVRRFDPKLEVSVGGGRRPWLATVSQRF